MEPSSSFDSSKTNNNNEKVCELTHTNDLPKNAKDNQDMHNWQATKDSVKDRLDFILTNSVQTDVDFLVGKGQLAKKISAHKLILSVGSAVFDSMFNSLLASSDKQIKIPDIEPSSFSTMLQFIYTDKATINADNVMTTLYAAKKYVIPALEMKCVEFLKNNLEPENAFLLLGQARIFDEPQLASLCLNCIDQNTKEAFKAETFLDIDIETLKRVLQRDTLGGMKEYQLFIAVESWANAECDRQGIEKCGENRRKVLGSVLDLIRFPLMQVEDFAKHCAQSGTLKDSEIVKIFLYFHSKPNNPIAYSNISRNSASGKEYTFNRFNGIAERWGYSGTSDSIRFSVNTKINLLGLGVYGATMGPTPYQVDIDCKLFDNGQSIGSNSVEFICDGSKKPFRIMFKRPVEIKAEFPYIVSAKINGQESYYGTGGKSRQMKVLTSKDKTVKFSFHHVKGNNNGTSVEDGQIPELIFSV